jgi:hypothetical protein
MKYFALFILMFILINKASCQENRSIYELGDSIETFDSNFTNLFKNWNPTNISNSEDFKLLDYSYVEVIDDSIKYRYYRNLFSGSNVLGLNTEIRSYSSYKKPGYYKISVAPSYAHEEIYDSRAYLEINKYLFSDSFRIKAIHTLELFLNIDSVPPYNFTYKIDQFDTIRSSNGYSILKKETKGTVASIDTVSQNYIDVVITMKRNIKDLTLNEARNLVLENILIEKISQQLDYNKKVKIGDVVYKVNFEYFLKTYSDYVICSSLSKKVVLDNCFKHLLFPNDNK